MKKNLLFTAFAAATMLLATSCQEEKVLDVNAGEEAVVSFNIGTPQIATRAFSDGTTATQLQYAVYDEQGNILPDLTVTDGTINIRQTVNLKLTTGNKYTVVFWAAEPNAPYAVDFAAKTMTVDYNSAAANDEKRDAFLNDTTFTVSGNMAMDVHLRRPFAQLNIGTSDYADSKSAGYTVTQTEVVVPVYQTLDIIEGTVASPVTVTYNMADIPADTETFPVSGYKYLSMNYLLMAKDKETVDVTFNYTDGSAEKTRTFGSVPVQRNYRTNIYGQLLTSDVDVTVEIIPEYDGMHEGWDGTTSTVPAYDATTKTYTVTNAAELNYIAQLVNGTLTTRAVEPNSLKGETVKLGCDIDLFGKEWTPIGNATNKFQGTFDGNRYAVKNLVISTGNDYVGLFGFTTDGEIKNLTVENAKVKGRVGTGVVAGSPYTSKYSNITVKGHVEVDGMAYVGTVGGRNAYANWTNITVDVDATSYVNANSVENGTAYRTYVGGVIGFMGEGNHTVSNVTSNIAVKGSTIDVGGIVGIAHYGNSFINCVCNADVEVYAAGDEADAQEIGGIAGVWMNSSANSPVTFEKCAFNGELKANDGYTINTGRFTDLVCAAYNNDGPGKLIIDGVEYMQTKDGVYVTIDGKQAEVVTDYTGFTDAISTENAVVYLGEGNYIFDEGNRKLSFAKGVTIYGNGNIVKMTWSSQLFTTQTTLDNVTIVGVNFANNTIMDMAYARGNVYFKDCTFSHDRGNQSVHFDGHAGAKVVFENCTFYGRNMYASALETVEFKNCKFLESTWNTEQGNNGTATGWSGINMWGKYKFDNCQFDLACTCNVKTNDVVAEFINCQYTDGSSDIKNVVSNHNNFVCTIIFDGKSNVASQENLEEALANGDANIELGAGEYTMPAGENFTAETVINCAPGVVFTGNSKLNINGATIIGATFSNPSGTAVDQTINGTFKGCTFEGSNGVRWAYAGETVVFEDCTFSGSVYGAHFDGGANDVIFRNCTLSGFNATAGSVEMVTFEGCTFKGNGLSSYNGANLWGSARMIDCEFTFDGTTQYEWIDCIGADKDYEFRNCTINGVPYTPENYTDYLNNIESRNDIKVVINGVKCAM